MKDEVRSTASFVSEMLPARLKGLCQGQKTAIIRVFCLICRFQLRLLLEAQITGAASLKRQMPVHAFRLAFTILAVQIGDNKVSRVKDYQ